MALAVALSTARAEMPRRATQRGASAGLCALYLDEYQIR